MATAHITDPESPCDDNIDVISTCSNYSVGKVSLFSECSSEDEFEDDNCESVHGEDMQCDFTTPSFCAQSAVIVDSCGEAFDDALDDGSDCSETAESLENDETIAMDCDPESPVANDQLEINQLKLCGCSIVGDNIDKNVRWSYERQDRTTNSLHYFHSYAVQN